MTRKSPWRLMKKQIGSWILEVWWDKRVASCMVSETESQRRQASHRDRKQLSIESNFLQMGHWGLRKSPQCCPCTVHPNHPKQLKEWWRSHKGARFPKWGSKFNFIFPYRKIWQLLSFHHFQAIHLVLHNPTIWGFWSVWAL